MPDDLLWTLQPPTMQSVMGQYGTAGQIGVGLAGFGQQINPFLAQERERFKQQVDLMKLRQSVQQQRERSKQVELGLYRDLLQSASPEGRKVGAQGIETHLKSLNQPVAPGFVESFESGDLSADKRKQVYLSVLAAQNDPALLAQLDTYLEKSLKVPKAMIPALKAEAQSPAIHKLLYGKTLQQEQLDIAKSEREEHRVNVLDRRVDLQEARDLQREIEGERRYRQAEDRLHLAQLASDRADKKLDWFMAHGPEEKRQRALDQGSNFVDQWEAAANKLQERGYLPPPGAPIYDPSYLSARTKRVVFPNDLYWTLFSKHLRADIVGYSRNVQGEIGPRFKAAFDGALGIAENPPDIESLRAVFKTMRSVIKLNREGKDTALFIYVRHPDGSVEKVPWKRGMTYLEGDTVIKVE